MNLKQHVPIGNNMRNRQKPDEKLNHLLLHLNMPRQFGDGPPYEEWHNVISSSQKTSDIIKSHIVRTNIVTKSVFVICCIGIYFIITSSRTKHPD